MSVRIFWRAVRREAHSFRYKDCRLVFAVIKTGGKQYKVQVGETIDVEKLAIEAGENVRLEEVLLAANDGDVAYGRPVIDGAVVTARVVRQHRGPKLIVFKYKSKSRYRRRTGHRQSLTQLAIQSIEIPGWEPARVPARERSAVVATAPTAPSGIEATPVLASREVAPAPVGVEASPALASSAASAPAGAPVVEPPMQEPNVSSAAPADDVLPVSGPAAQIEATEENATAPETGVSE